MTLFPAILFILSSYTPVTPPEVVPPAPQTRPAITLNSARHPFVMWSDAAARGGRMIDIAPIEHPALLDPMPYADAAAASIGTQSAGAWIANGAAWLSLDAAAPISLGLAGGSERIAVAASSEGYFVVWTAPAGISGTVVDVTGRIVRYVTFLNTDADSLAIAALNDTVLIVWEASHQIHVARWRGGNLEGGTIDVVASNATLPDVATDGHDFFLIWTNLGGANAISGMHITKDAIGSTIPIEIGSVLSAGAARIAWDGFAYDIAFLESVQAHQYIAPGLVVNRYTPDGKIYAPAFSGFLTSPGEERGFSIAARDGLIAVAYTTSTRVYVQTAEAGPLPGRRGRAVRR